MVLNWPADVGFDERLSAVYRYEETTSILDEFVPQVTPTPTDPPPKTIESFEDGSLSGYRGDLDAFETSQDRGGGGDVALRSRNTDLSVISGLTVAAKKGPLRVKGRSILRVGPKSHPVRLMLGGDRSVACTLQSRPGCRRSTDIPMLRHPQEAKPCGRDRSWIESGGPWGDGR